MDNPSRLQARSKRIQRQSPDLVRCSVSLRSSLKGDDSSMSEPCQSETPKGYKSNKNKVSIARNSELQASH